MDSHLYQGYSLPVFYDSLIAKLITFDSSRQGAISIMKRALAEYSIHPIKTTIPLFQEIMADEEFRKGNFDTSYIGKFVPDDDDDDEEEDE